MLRRLLTRGRGQRAALLPVCVNHPWVADQRERICCYRALLRL